MAFRILVIGGSGFVSGTLARTALAQGQPATDASFDHAKTGYFLGAQHVSARCESCHTQGSCA
jgi:hypothetical protein